MPAKKSTKTKKKMPKKASAKKVSTKKVSAKKVSTRKVSTKKPAKASKPVAKKKISPKAKATLANNKSKIAPYKLRKNEKYMSARMKKHFIAVLLLWKEHLKEEMQKTFDHLKTKGELMQIRLIERLKKRSLLLS